MAQADSTTPANSKLAFALDLFTHNKASAWDWIKSWLDTSMGPRQFAAAATDAPLMLPGGFDTTMATALG